MIMTINIKKSNGKRWEITEVITVIRKAEDSESTIPSNIATYRAAVRTRSNEMEAAIDGAADAAAMEALYTYTNTGTEENPVYTRPLGEWPELS